MLNQLPIPAPVKHDPNALELLRVWAANGQQYVSLEATAWENPAAWGIMLVDIAKHVAAAYHQTMGTNPDLVLHQIKQGFDAEWEHPSDSPEGKIEGG